MVEPRLKLQLRYPINMMIKAVVVEGEYDGTIMSLLRQDTKATSVIG
jgi:hypothetical protein